jgi:hypothetical protein
MGIKTGAKSPTQVLLDRGEDLRGENPVLWTIIRGRGTLERIGLLSGQPSSVVKAEVERLIQARIIYASERYAQPVYMLNPKSSGYAQLKKLSLLYLAMELKFVESASIDLRKEKGLVSSAAFKKWCEDHPSESSRGRTERYDDHLTMKQAGVLVAVGMGWADRSTFKPLELARLQGYTQGGYAKQSLLSLESKGFVKSAGEKHFRLTPAGVDKVRELQDAGIKAARKEQIKLDVDSL